MFERFECLICLFLQHSNLFLRFWGWKLFLKTVGVQNSIWQYRHIPLWKLNTVISFHWDRIGKMKIKENLKSFFYDGAVWKYISILVLLRYSLFFGFLQSKNRSIISNQGFSKPLFRGFKFKSQNYRQQKATYFRIRTRFFYYGNRFLVVK